MELLSTRVVREQYCTISLLVLIFFGALINLRIKGSVVDISDDFPTWLIIILFSG
jgi:hypothetical protein